MTNEEKEQLERLLYDYIDVFSLGEDDMGLSTVTQHSIDTGESRPVDRHCVANLHRTKEKLINM